MKNDKSQVYTTIIVLAAALLAIHFIFKVGYLDYAALGLLLISIFIFPVARLVSKGWMKFAELLGTFNSKVILSVLFFVFLTPIAFFYRLFNKDTLHLKKNTDNQGYYIERNHLYKSEDFNKTF